MNAKTYFASRKGFTLIELLVVIGILAVLAAIAIPSVAGLIDRANVSADDTNCNEMTNAIERFASEYELYCQDIASGVIKDTDSNGVPDNMDSAQGRVFNVTQAISRGDIELLEKPASAGTDTTGRAIFRDTKYPVNAETARAIVENYTKTSSSTFEPKQSDMHYWYSPDCGVVVFGEPESTVAQLNAQIQSGQDAKGNTLSDSTKWIDLTAPTDGVGGAGGADEALDMSTVDSVLANNDWATIKKVIQAGKVAEAGWSVGDKSPTFTINNQTKQAILVDINSNNATFMLASAIGYEEMNHETDEDGYDAGKSSGGYAASAMKAWLDGTVYNGLDADLKAVISSTSVPCAGGPDAARTTTNVSCHLFLPSVIEMNQHELLFMWGYYPYEAEIRSEGSTFDFFANGGEIEDDEGIWMRTPTCTMGEGYFYNSLYGGNDIGCAYENLAVCPAFVVG